MRLKINFEKISWLNTLVYIQPILYVPEIHLRECQNLIYLKQNTYPLYRSTCTLVYSFLFKKHQKGKTIGRFIDGENLEMFPSIWKILEIYRRKQENVFYFFILNEIWKNGGRNERNICKLKKKDSTAKIMFYRYIIHWLKCPAF